MRWTFWTGQNNWRGYKATTIAATCAIVNELLDNYWIFTSTPMSGSDHSEAASKFFYLITQVIAMGTYGGVIGLGVDYLRSMYKEEVGLSESDALIQPH